jgi:hypothetical protein
MKLTASLDVYVLHSPTSALEIGDEVIKEWKEEDARLSAGGRGSAKKSIRLAKGSSAEVPPQSFVLVQAEGRPAVVATYEGAGGYWRAAVIDLAEQKVVTGPVDLSGEKPLLTLGSPGATVSLALLPDGALRVADLHSDGTTTVTASGAVSVAVPAGPESLLASAEQVERNVKRLRLGRRPWFVFQSSIVIRFVLGMLKHGLFPGPHETLERYRMRVARLGGTQDEQWNHCLFILQQMVADEEVKSVADAEASLAHWVDRALEETQDLLAHRREAETPTPTPTATPTPIPESVGFTLLESRSAGLADMKRGDELEPHLGPRFVGALTKTSDDDATFEPMRRYLESLQGRSRDESAAEQEDEALGAGRPEWTMESINSYYELLASPDRRRALAAHLLAIGQDTAMRDEFLAGLVLLHQAGGSLSGANLDESSPEPAHRAAREQDARLAVEWLAFSGAARGMSIADARSELNAILARQADRVLRRTEALARWQAQGARDVKAREAELMRYPIVVDFNGFESWSPEEFAQRAAWLAGAFAASLTSRNAAGVLVTTPRKPQELRDALIRAHPDFQNAWGLRILGAEECKGLYVENKRLSLPALRESFGYRNFSLVVTADESLLDKGEFRDVTVWTFARIDAVVRAALERLRFILIQA